MHMVGKFSLMEFGKCRLHMMGLRATPAHLLNEALFQNLRAQLQI
jgi:hypothetical protein